jgi:iron complex outermembrane receptor protein
MALAGALQQPAYAAQQGQQAGQEARAFDIPAQPLSSALLQYSRQSNIVVVVPGSLVAGDHAPAVRGVFTPDAALALLLAGSGLRPQKLLEGGLTLVQSHPASLEHPSQAADPTQVPEIVVTAQRREQRLQDVPVSVTAIGADMARKLNISSSTDVAKLAPALSTSPDTTGARINVRGAGGSGSASDEPANAIYIDGVYQGAVPGQYFSLNSIERIEVDKGPQGTLFGRNALAGVVQIITKTPQQIPLMDASISYGNYDTLQEQLYVTGGIGQSLAADLSIYNSHQGKGWGKNLFDGRDAYQGRAFSARSKLLWNIDENTSATVAISYSDTKAPTVQGGQIAPGHTTILGSGPDGFYDINHNFQENIYSKQNGAALTLTHDLGWAHLTSISSYLKTKLFLDQDQDMTPVNIVSVNIYYPVTDIAQELQLQSPRGSDTNWTIGAIYYNATLSVEPVTVTGLAVAPAASFQQFGRQKSESYAIYGQATREILKDLNLTLGLRYTHDDKSVRYSAFANGAAIPGSVSTNSGSDDVVTWNATLDHRFSKSTMAYVSSKRGYHSGPFNLISPANPAVKPTFLDAYAVGLKTSLLEGRLIANVEAFHYKYNDIQVQVPQIGGVFLENAAAGRINGIDLDLTAVPVRRLTVRAGLSYLDGKYTSFPNASYFAANPMGGDIPFTGNATGNDLVLAPELTLNVSVAYVMDTGLGPIDLGANAYHVTEMFNDPQNALPVAEHTLVDASIGWRNSTGLELRIWVNNAFNKRYLAFSNPQSLGALTYPSAPRTFGVTLRKQWQGG